MSSTPDDDRWDGASRILPDREVFNRRVEAGWIPDVERLPAAWRREGDLDAVMTPGQVQVAHDRMHLDDYLEAGWLPETGPNDRQPRWVYERSPGPNVVWPMRWDDVILLASRGTHPEFASVAELIHRGVLDETCRWPADAHAPTEAEDDWDACGNPAVEEISNGPTVRWLVRLPVCEIHRHAAYRAGWHRLEHPAVERVETSASAPAVSGFGPASAQDWMRTAADVLVAESRKPADLIIAEKLRQHADALDVWELPPPPHRLRWRRILAAYPLQVIENCGIGLSEWAGAHLDQWRRDP